MFHEILVVGLAFLKILVELDVGLVIFVVDVSVLVQLVLDGLVLLGDAVYCSLELF
jgi:hypothetical protein